MDPLATAGYRVYRSERRDGGYEPLGGTLSATTNIFTDALSGLIFGRTYWYKIAGIGISSDSKELEGSPSTAAPATPGPTDGIFYLEAEDATIIQLSSSSDWDSLNRRSLPDPFHGNGMLYVKPSTTAAPGVAFITLQWSKEIDRAGPGGAVQTYDVYISLIRNSSSAIFDIFIQEPISGTSTIIRTGYDFFLPSVGFPQQQNLHFLGQLTFTDENFFGGIPTNETINCRLGYQGKNFAAISESGELLFDGLVLIRR